VADSATRPLVVSSTSNVDILAGQRTRQFLAASLPIALPRAQRGVACALPPPRLAASCYSLCSQAPRRRVFAGVADSATQPLVVTSTSNVGILAGGVSKQLRGGTKPSLSAVGPSASYMAFKAVIIAETYLRKERQGKIGHLAVVPEKTSLTTLVSPETFGLLLHVVEVQALEFPERPDLFSAQNTNVGRLAKVVANALESADAVTIGSMGAQAASNVLKATLIAQAFMAEALGENGKLAIVPRYGTFDFHGEERRRMLLKCVKV